MFASQIELLLGPGASSLTPVLRTHCGDVADRTFHRSLTPPWCRMTYLTLHVLCSFRTLSSQSQNCKTCCMSSYTVFFHCTVSDLTLDLAVGLRILEVMNYFSMHNIFLKIITHVSLGDGGWGVCTDKTVSMSSLPPSMSVATEIGMRVKKLYLSYRMNVELNYVKTGNVYFCFSVNMSINILNWS